MDAGKPLEDYIMISTGKSLDEVLADAEKISFTELEPLLAEHIRYFDDAVTKKAVYPYLQENQVMMQYLRIIAATASNFIEAGEKHSGGNDGISIDVPVYDTHGMVYAFTLNKKNAEQARDIIYNKAEELDYSRVSLFMTNEDSERQVEIEILPGIDGEREVYGMAKLIVPTKNKESGLTCYPVFSISVENNHNKPQVHMNILTGYNYHSLEDVMKYEDMEDALTVGIAKNTEHYPLEETSLLLIAKRYMALLWPGSNIVNLNIL